MLLRAHLLGQRELTDHALEEVGEEVSPSKESLPQAVVASAALEVPCPISPLSLEWEGRLARSEVHHELG